MNQVLLIGRLTKDPELKYSQSGKAFCRFSIAVTKEFNRNETDFFDCVAWNKTAEIIAEYMRKGKETFADNDNDEIMDDDDFPF